MKQINIFVILFAAVFLNAQMISGTVKSQSDKSAIPYAKIGIENDNKGTIADENGNFSFDLTDVPHGKTVKIEVGGFEVFKTSVANFIMQNPQNIFLNEKVREIAEVKLSPKKLVSKNWGVNTKSKSVMYSVDPKLREDEYLRETAVEFNTKKRAKIEKINLNIANFESDKPVMLRYTIYNQKNGLPGDPILTRKLSFR